MKIEIFNLKLFRAPIYSITYQGGEKEAAKSEPQHTIKWNIRSGA